jgi:hypothetical protein
MTPKKTSGNLVAFGEKGFLCGESKQYVIIMDYTDCMRRRQWRLYRDKICATDWKYWGCFKQIWNTGTLYERENKARGVVTCTLLSGFTQPVLSPISNPYYLLDRVQAVAQEYTRGQCSLPCGSTQPATARGHVWSVPFFTYTRHLET